MGQRPHYVNTLKNRYDRSVICKIRISAHSLMIERGRYFNINKNERHSNMQNKTGRRWKSLYFKMQKIWTNQTQILWQCRKHWI